MDQPTLEKLPRKALASIGIEKAFIISRLTIAAERVQLFRLLGRKRLKADRIGRGLKIHPYFLRPLLDSLAGLGLLRKDGDLYWNSPLALRYFLDERSIHWTRQYSKECVAAYDALTVLEEALASGESCKRIKKPEEPSYTEAMKRDRQQAEDFTQMLFYFHQETAGKLARTLGLGGRHAVLDAGGGSGVMSIALCKRNAQLRACVLDIAPVCEIAARNIRRARLSSRVTTMAGDFSRALPGGYDVILFCDVGEVSAELLRRACNSLPANGRVVLMDRYLSEDGTRPLDRLVHHFVSNSFGLASWAEMVKRLENCGFGRVKAKRAADDYWLITGSKLPVAGPRS